jgi:SWI/SNF-related matrix-associated actin-dependent regulator of chromatin subfamily A member 5
MREPLHQINLKFGFELTSTALSCPISCMLKVEILLEGGYRIHKLGEREGSYHESVLFTDFLTQLRKVTCHPYLFGRAVRLLSSIPPFALALNLDTLGNFRHIGTRHTVCNRRTYQELRKDGYPVQLDKLLASMKAKGSGVLIFNQICRVLDILENYCLLDNIVRFPLSPSPFHFRSLSLPLLRLRNRYDNLQLVRTEYCHIDGGTAHDDRISSIDEYNQPGSEKFILLLTTCTGGLSINLTTVDIVVLYDSDW